MQELSKLFANEELLRLIGYSSIALLFASPLIALLTALALPKDILLKKSRKSSLFGYLILTLKNLLALVIFISGILMLVIPGPGILTIFVSFLISDFSLKRRIYSRVLAQPRLIHNLNSLRQRFGVAPLTWPD